MGRTDLVPVVLDQVRGEIPEQYLDCAKAHRVLGWRPRYSLEQGLRETIDWYSQRHPANVPAGIASPR
jgi:nucleoside-diphosphate-sugar epimerase